MYSFHGNISIQHLLTIYQACQSALGTTEFYEHSKTESWNTTIIVCPTHHFQCFPTLPTSSFSDRTCYSQNSILKSLISESSPAGGTPSFKYAVNSTIIQHLVPTSSLKAKATQESSAPPTSDDYVKISTSDVKSEATSTDGKPHVGRRGMHSATGAYWNEKTDGMWSFKYEGGEKKGLDVVISVIWISI